MQRHLAYIHLRIRRSPANLYYSFSLFDFVADVRAILAVDCESSAARDESDYAVTGHRQAAATDVGEHAVDPFDNYARARLSAKHGFGARRLLFLFLPHFVLVRAP